MVLRFYLRYGTRVGQQIYIVSEDLSGRKSKRTEKVSMQYIDRDYWRISIQLSNKFSRDIRYYYIVEDQHTRLQMIDGEKDRILTFHKNLIGRDLVVVDTWNDTGDERNVFYTKVFRNLLREERPQEAMVVNDYNHEFRVKANLTNPKQTMCMLGSTLHFHNWDTESPVLMTKEGDWYVARLRLEEHEWPVAYKYGVYDNEERKFLYYEEGENRILRKWNHDAERVVAHDGFANIPHSLWRGTGVNVPVFSLRSAKSFGAGDFMDLKLLVDWCRLTGIRLIQLLPVNDTSARDNWMDSYPYSAISAFALHPLYLNPERMAAKEHKDIIRKYSSKQKRLNALQRLDYEKVMKLKRAIVKEMYELQKDNLQKDKKFLSFFRANKNWLVPYAAFCFLKNKNKTADFSRWKTHSKYDEKAIADFVSPAGEHYHQVAIYYYEQYHLHLQLIEAVEYANQHGIVLKGDLPIGIYRYSCDVWMNPALYNLEEQAGAPPDAFSPAGQNWRFPTYNWQEMQKNHFDWWRQRFDQSGKYFDAFRIDHILGFFRIWSIPIEQIDGTMGRFVPAIPIDISEFEKDRINFDYARYCQPFINDEILAEIFGGDAEKVIEAFLISGEGRKYSLRDCVTTQQKALQYLEDNGMVEYREGLFKLMNNVILFAEKDATGTKFYFNINMEETSSFQSLDSYTQSQLRWLYNNYFFERQEHFWENEAMQKLPQLKRTTDMLVCGEDLGMVPSCVPDVMRRLGILGLNVQRMADKQSARFLNLRDVNYLSVVQPSTHDMSTLREWWEEDPERTQIFYNEMLWQNGEAPATCTPAIVTQIIRQHLQSPAMWSIFLLQDLLAVDNELRTDAPSDERINIPADPHHYWRYRMHGDLETLISKEEMIEAIHSLIREGGRLHSH